MRDNSRAILKDIINSILGPQAKASMRSKKKQEMNQEEGQKKGVQILVKPVQVRTKESELSKNKKMGAKWPFVMIGEVFSQRNKGGQGFAQGRVEENASQFALSLVSECEFPTLD